MGYEVIHRDLEHYLDMINDDPPLDLNYIDPLITLYYTKTNKLLNNNNVSSELIKQNIFNYPRVNLDINHNFASLYSKFKKLDNSLNFLDINFQLNLISKINIYDLININFSNIYYNFFNKYKLENKNKYLFFNLYEENLNHNIKHYNLNYSINLQDLIIDNLSVYYDKNIISLKKKKNKKIKKQL